MVTQLARLLLAVMAVISNSAFLEIAGAAAILAGVFLWWGWPAALVTAGGMLLLRAEAAA